jgi:hypothetical protein
MQAYLKMNLCLYKQIGGKNKGRDKQTEEMPMGVENKNQGDEVGR